MPFMPGWITRFASLSFGDEQLFTRQRHHDHLSACLSYLRAAAQDHAVGSELAAECLRAALGAFGTHRRAHRYGSGFG